MLDIIKLKINDQEYQVKKTFRSLMLFEELSGKAITDIKETVGDLILLFYSILKSNNPDTFKFTYNEFLDLLDNYPEAIEEFNTFLISQTKTTANIQEKKTKKH